MVILLLFITNLSGVQLGRGSFSHALQIELDSNSALSKFVDVFRAPEIGGLGFYLK